MFSYGIISSRKPYVLSLDVVVSIYPNTPTKHSYSNPTTKSGPGVEWNNANSANACVYTKLHHLVVETKHLCKR